MVWAAGCELAPVVRAPRITSKLTNRNQAMRERSECARIIRARETDCNLGEIAAEHGDDLITRLLQSQRRYVELS